MSHVITRSETATHETDQAVYTVHLHWAHGEPQLATMTANICWVLYMPGWTCPWCVLSPFISNYESKQAYGHYWDCLFRANQQEMLQRQGKTFSAFWCWVTDPMSLVAQSGYQWKTCSTQFYYLLLREQLLLSIREGKKPSQIPVWKPLCSPSASHRSMWLCLNLLPSSASSFGTIIYPTRPIHVLSSACSLLMFVGQHLHSSQQFLDSHPQQLSVVWAPLMATKHMTTGPFFFFLKSSLVISKWLMPRQVRIL
jgi:hypothetical protein